MIEYEYRVRMLTSPGSPDRDYEVPEGWAQAEIERELRTTRSGNFELSRLFSRRP